MTLGVADRPRTPLEVDGQALEMGSWAGEGTPLLLLHEGLGSVSMWRDFPGLLADVTRRPVVAWSRQGYGWSEPLPDARDPDYMHVEADRLPRLLDALGIERAALFGHSDGGSIALLAAARFPDRVEALILEAPHIYVEQVTVDSIAAIRDVYQRSDLAERLGRHHRDADEVFWRWNNIWLEPRFRSWNIEECLADIRAPALLIQGLEDEYGTLEQLNRIEAMLDRVCRLELTNCGHSPHRDQPAAVLEGVAAFLGELSPC